MTVPLLFLSNILSKDVLGLGSRSFFKIISDLCDFRRYSDGQEEKIVPILKIARQGIAAQNIGGITLMRASKQRPFQTSGSCGDNAKITAELDQLLPRIGTLILDEISMISAVYSIRNNLFWFNSPRTIKLDDWTATFPERWISRQEQSAKQSMKQRFRFVAAIKKTTQEDSGQAAPLWCYTYQSQKDKGTNSSGKGPADRQRKSMLKRGNSWEFATMKKVSPGRTGQEYPTTICNQKTLQGCLQTGKTTKPRLHYRWR